MRKRCRVLAVAHAGAATYRRCTLGSSGGVRVGGLCGGRGDQGRADCSRALGQQSFAKVGGKHLPPGGARFIMPQWGFTYRIEIVEQLLNRETCMDSRVLTITSGKGGVGKTTTTANLGTALAMQGKKVAGLDADIGLRNLHSVIGVENRIGYALVDVVERQCHLRHS